MTVYPEDEPDQEVKIYGLPVLDLVTRQQSFEARCNAGLRPVRKENSIYKPQRQDVVHVEEDALQNEYESVYRKAPVRRAAKNVCGKRSVDRPSDSSSMKYREEAVEHGTGMRLAARQ